MALIPIGLSPAAHAQSADPGDGSFDRLDINNDGVLSGSEAKSVTAYDLDGDGEVTRAEYEAGRRKAAPPPKKIEPVPARDADAELRGLAEKRADELFDKLDANQDDRLSGNEIRPEHRSYDVDGDMRITRAELVAGVMKTFGFDSPPVPNRPDNVPPRRGDPPRGNGDAWIRSSLGTIGVTFETPRKPKFMIEKTGGVYMDASVDQPTQFTVRFTYLMPGKDNSAALAKSRAELLVDGILVSSEKLKVADASGEALTVRMATDPKTIMRAWLLLVDDCILQMVCVKSDVARPSDVPEFDRFFESVKVAPKDSEGVRNPPLPTTMPADSAGVHAAFVQAIANSKPGAAYLMCAPELANTLDPHVLRIFMENLYDTLGAVKSTGLDGFRPELKNDGGGVVVAGKSTLEFADGAAEISTTVMDGKVIDFSIHSPKIDMSLGASIAERINSLPPKLRDSFLKDHTQGNTFLQELFTNGADAALALFDEGMLESLKSRGEVEKLHDMLKRWGKIKQIELFAINAEEVDPTTTGLTFTYKVTLPSGKIERADVHFSIVELQTIMTGFNFGLPFADDDASDINPEVRKVPLGPVAPAAPAPPR